MIIRPMQPSDWPEWRRMRTALWHDQTEDDLSAWCASSDALTIVALRDNGLLCGFAEASIRPLADGCTTSPVAYLEGWYVDSDCRRTGVGRALVAAVEAWARSRGLREIASDAELDNKVSQAAHARLGFAEVGRAVMFAKRIKSRAES